MRSAGVVYKADDVGVAQDSEKYSNLTKGGYTDITRYDTAPAHNYTPVHGV